MGLERKEETHTRQVGAAGTVDGARSSFAMLNVIAQ